MRPLAGWGPVKAAGCEDSHRKIIENDARTVFPDENGQDVSVKSKAYGPIT
jgi:hypothetical protein